MELRLQETASSRDHLAEQLESSNVQFKAAQQALSTTTAQLQSAKVQHLACFAQETLNCPILTTVLRNHTSHNLIVLYHQSLLK